MKKNDDLQLSSQLSELKLTLRDKELNLREIQHASSLKEKDLTLQLERLREALNLKELELADKTAEWERERKSLGENGFASRRTALNYQREQQIMSGVFHKMAQELFMQKHYGATNTN